MTPVVCLVLSVETGTSKRIIFLSVDLEIVNNKLLVEPGAEFQTKLVLPCSDTHWWFEHPTAISSVPFFVPGETMGKASSLLRF